MNEVEECFKNAIKDDKKRKKHKGLLNVKPNDKKAQEYIIKV